MALLDENTQIEEQAEDTKTDEGLKSFLTNEEYKNDPSVEKFKDVDSLFKSYKEISKLKDRQGIVIPKEGDDPEVYENFYKAIGRPETPDKYDLNVQAEIPDDLKVDETTIEGFKKTAYELGLSAGQTQQLYEFYLNSQIDKYNELKLNAEKTFKEVKSNLEKEFGDKFKEKLETANKVITELGSEELESVISQYGLNNNPEFVKFMIKIGENIQNDVIGKMPTSSSQMTQDEINKEIEAITGDRAGALYVRTHPNHDKAVKRLTELYKALED